MSTLSSFNTDFNVEKSNGKKEQFSPDKIITACMNVGASFIQASKIASEVSAETGDGTPTAKIRELVYTKLKSIEPQMAEQYMYRLHMTVKTSKTILENFDAQRIADSLIKETNLDETHANLIAREVEKELAKLHLKHVTAPLIREIVNVKLLEHGLESARARYTRLGMPVHDVKELIEHSKDLKYDLQYNPQTLHKLMADQISREYTLLNVLPGDLSDAHMSGKIHIHDLDYFSIRPMGGCHDIRFFLKNGIKAGELNKLVATSGPAKKPSVAFLHAAKILSASQANSSGSQNLNYLNVFLAPYIVNLEYEEVRQLTQMLIYQLSQMYSSRGGQMIYSSIDLSLNVPSLLSDVPAVQPSGLIDSNVTYNSFEKQALTLAKAFIDSYSMGDYNKKPFTYPKLNIRLNKTVLTEPLLESILLLSGKHRNVNFIIERSHSPRPLSYHSPSFLMPSVKKDLHEYLLENYPRGGALQAVTLNLPQLAYEAEGDDDKLFNSLDYWVKRARDVLLLKLNLIENNLNSGLLSFLSQSVDGERYYEPQQQNLVVCFTGLYEMVKTHTRMELHDKHGSDFGLKFIKYMRSLVDQLSERSDLNFALAASPWNSSALRMAQIDLMNYPKAITQEDNNESHYTNSHNLPDLEHITLEDRIENESMFSPHLNGGSIASFKLDDYSIENLFQKTRYIVDETKIPYFTFI